MSKSERQKKERRRSRQFAANMEKGANREAQKVGANVELVEVLRDAADLGKKLGTIRGKREIKAKHARTK